MAVPVLKLPRQERLILMGSSISFIFIAILFIALTLWHETSLHQTLITDLKIKANTLGTETIPRIKTELHERYRDLSFITDLYVHQAVGKKIPKELKTALEDYQNKHPSVQLINIQSVNGKQVLWSTHPRWVENLPTNKNYYSISTGSDRLVGLPFFSKNLKGWVIPIRYRATSPKTHATMGFIGIPFLLSRLPKLPNHNPYIHVVIESKTGRPLVEWRNNHWINHVKTNPTQLIASSTESIGQFPLKILIGWKPQGLKTLFWEKEWPRLVFLAGALLLLLLLGVVSRFLLLQVFCMRQYLSAAIQTENSMLQSQDTNETLQILVKTIAKNTNLGGVVLFEISEGSLICRQVSTLFPTLSATLLNQALPNNYSSDLLSMTHLKKIIGPNPLNPSNLPTRGEDFAGIPTLFYILIPVFIGNNQAPSYGLSIIDRNPKTFKQSLLNLFEQLTINLGLQILRIQQQNALSEQAQQIEHMAYYDSLTGLPNRNLFDIEITKALARTQRNQSLLAVCMMDLDGFKPINDTYGHAAGDIVLKTLGDRLPKALRTEDLVIRLGGDEFVILLENIKAVGHLEKILEKISQTIQRPITINQQTKVRLSASMGVAIYPFIDNEFDGELLRKADLALYRSKANKHHRRQSWTLFESNVI